MKKFDQDNLKSLRTEINAALAAIEKKHGITFKLGNISYDSNSFNTKLSGFIQEENEKGLSADEIKWRKDFKEQSIFLGVPAENLDRTLSFDGDEYTLVGLRVRARKTPFVIKRCSDGAFMVVSKDFIMTNLSLT